MACGELSAEGLAHAFTLRDENGPTPSRGPSQAVLGRLRLDGLVPAVPSQVHGSAVAIPDDAGLTRPREADAVLVVGSGSAAVATADCVPAILHAPGRGAFAVVHAGWRGTLAGVLPRAVGALSEAAGVPPSSLSLALGPAAGRCCYEVGPEVIEAFASACGPGILARAAGARGGRATLDLVEANRAQAESAGLRPERIHDSGICTVCRQDLCWSYRASGRAAGRMWAVAGLPAIPSSEARAS